MSLAWTENASLITSLSKKKWNAARKWASLTCLDWDTALSDTCSWPVEVMTLPINNHHCGSGSGKGISSRGMMKQRRQVRDFVLVQQHKFIIPFLLTLENHSLIAILMHVTTSHNNCHGNEPASTILELLRISYSAVDVSNCKSMNCVPDGTII